MSMDAPAKINFFKGHPSNRLLPNKEIIDATTQLLSPQERPYDNETENRHPLTYGSDEGAIWVRNAICEFNNDEIFHISSSQDNNMISKPEYLNLTSGASYGILNILLQTTLPHTGYTKQAFIVTPTYFLINDCFIDAGFGDNKLTAIDELPDDNSIDFKLLLSKLDYLESQDDRDESEDIKCVINKERSTKIKKIYKYVMYCVPTFANPSGMTFSHSTKLKLIEIARKYDMLIISDDVYDILNYNTNDSHDDDSKRRLVHLDRQTNNNSKSFGNTISNSTFSKIIAPGLRFGYQETINNNLVQQLSKGGANVSGGTPAQLNSMIVGTLLTNGDAKRIISRLIDTYSQRASILSLAIKKYLPRRTIFDTMQGGYFTWVTLPEGYNAMQIQEILKVRHQVIMANGSNFEVVADKRHWGLRSVRLSISFLEETDIEEGIRLWGEVCKDYAQDHDLIF